VNGAHPFCIQSAKLCLLGNGTPLHFFSGISILGLFFGG